MIYVRTVSVKCTTMKMHASSQSCPLLPSASHLCLSSHASFLAHRTGARLPRHSRRHQSIKYRQLSCQKQITCGSEKELDGHVCRRSVLALGVAGFCVVQRTQRANAETALPPELREQSRKSACQNMAPPSALCWSTEDISEPPSVSPLQAKPCKGLCSS